MLKLIIFLGLFYGTVFSNAATDNSDCIGKSNGIFVSSSDCSSFFMCSGGFKTVHKCPEPLLFSPNLLVCDWAQNVKCGQLEGAEEVESSGGNASDWDCADLNSGLYPNPEDCTTFYECSNGDAYIFECPPGLIFNPTYLICDWPSASNVCRESTRPPVQNTTTTEQATTTTTTTTTERINTTTTELQVPTTELPEEEETTEPPQEETTQAAVTDVTDVTDDNSGEEGSPTTHASVTQTEDDGSSEEDEESTTESSSESSEEEGETTEDSQDETTEAPTTVRTTTLAPKFCVGKPNGLYPNPEDCTSFYKCTNQYTYLIKCPAGNYFDPDKVGCFDDPSVCEAYAN